ncbi:Sec-independent protein translocase subunit TatB [Helicobacter sp. MIT 05-5293]|uniref:Sec-independent protein translocase protein TatB n=1 Tax=Helicobacter sp. MIT 05-5293 TaxID=1548149 RepID=UPI00068D291F|nr:Sec-independent protein translocase protein TatB [Helicobacter sp. MIT 05-5293]TLD80136.1 Sec-independent protein translocase subunit TatB [Helicobacter sp. MIT 05-5293]
MFGAGIFEILIILIVAVIALGPNKLPQTIVDVVKFFRAFKKTIHEAKETFDKEIQLAELKQEALKYKNTIEDGMKQITQDMKLDELREISADAVKSLNTTLEGLNNEITYDSPSLPKQDELPAQSEKENQKENHIAADTNTPIESPTHKTHKDS